MSERSPASRAILILAALCGLGPAAPRTCFEAARPLSPPAPSTDLGFNFKKSIATLPDGSVHAVWYAEQGGISRIFYRRSLDGGDLWEPPRALSPPAAPAEHPAIAAAGESVYVAWHRVGPGGLDVVLRRSDDGGGHFEPPVPLSASGAAAHASLAASGPRVYAVWSDSRSGVAEIHARVSEDGGRSFGPEQILSEEPHASWVPSVDAEGDVAVVAWVDYRDANEEEYVRASRDGGRSWDPAVRVTFDPADSWAPSVAVRGASVFLAWFDRRPAGLLDGDVEAALDAAASLLGLSFAPAPPRDPALYYLPGFQQRVAEKLAAIHAAAPDWVARGGDPQQLAGLLDEFARRREVWSRGWGIFLARSPDLGATWEPARLVATPGGPAARPSLDVAAPDLHLAWYDGRHGLPEIYYRHSPDAGSHFGPERRLTQTPGASLRPSLAAAGRRVHVVWLEESENRIFYRRGLVTAAPAAE